MRKKWRSFLKTLRFFVPYIKVHTLPLAISLLLSLGYVIMGILEPLPVRWIFDCVLFQERPLPQPFSYMPEHALWMFVAMMIVIGFVRGIFYYYQQLLTARAGQQIASRVRQDLYAHVQKLCLPLSHTVRLGDAITHLITDVKALREMLVSTSSVVLREALLSLAMLAAMFCIDWQLTLVGLLCLPLIFLYLKRYQRSFVDQVHSQRQCDGDLTATASESLGGIKLVQGFQKEAKESGEFRALSTKLLDSFTQATQLLSKMRCSSEVAIILASALVLGIAGNHILRGLLTPGDLLVFVYYLRNFSKPFKKIALIADKVTRGAVSGRRIMQLMLKKPLLRPSKSSLLAPRFYGKIVFDKVSYAYPSRDPVLSAFDLTIFPGEHIGLVGPCGVGKSTLVSLIPRFSDPTSGRILIDDVDVRNYRLSSLRRRVSCVFQDPILFTGTIRENIVYGRPNADFSEIESITNLLGIHDRILALPLGYETPVGQGGSWLSGGQKQCIAIARALVKDAPIVIMDEPLSALDPLLKDQVLSGIRKFLSKRTLIMISHEDFSENRLHRVVRLTNLSD